MWQFLAQLLSLTSAFLKRRWKRDDDPAEQNLQRHDKIDTAIATGDAESVNRQLTDSLRKLPNPDRGHSGRPRS